MKVVERYVLRRVLGFFAASLVWTLAMVWTTQVLSRIDLVTDNGQSALTFFEVATLILPSIIPIVVPFALLIAVAQTLTVMNSDSELVVISAAGSSRLAIIRPVLILAALASVFSFVVDNAVDPYARERGRHLVAEARADLLSLVIQEGTFKKVEDGLFVQIGERLPDGRLGGIFVADSRAKDIDLIYYAKTGAVVPQGDKKVLIMNDGVVHRKTPAGEVSVVRFTAYTFDLSAFSADTSEITMFPKDRTIAYLLNPDPNDPVYQYQPRSFRVEAHRRFTEWLFPLVFSLIALAVAGDARSHREGRINPLITSVTVCLLVRWLAFFVTNQSTENEWLTPFVYGVPLGASAIALWFISSNRSMELPLAWSDRMLALGERTSRLWQKAKRGGRPLRDPA
jgi:lipopolysaccharide export system permease protein